MTSNENQKSIYNCEKCNYKCIFISQWKKHIETEKHKNGKRKTRTDKKLPKKCQHCDYKTEWSSSMKVHNLTKHGTKEDRKKEFKYYCDKCDFGTYANILYKRHCETKKHTL